MFYFMLGKVLLNVSEEVVHLTLPPHIFFRPSKVWSVLHHGSVGASSE